MFFGLLLMIFIDYIFKYIFLSLYDIWYHVMWWWTSKYLKLPRNVFPFLNSFNFIIIKLLFLCQNLCFVHSFVSKAPFLIFSISKQHLCIGLIDCSRRLDATRSCFWNFVHNFSLYIIVDIFVWTSVLGADCRVLAFL